MQKSVAVIFGVFFVVGLLVLGLNVKSGFQSQKYADSQSKVVTVVGFASKIVAADGAFWPIEVVNSGDILDKVLEKNGKDKEALKAFFAEVGISENDVIFEDVRVFSKKDGTDAYSAYGLDKNFIASQNLLVQSSDIKAFKAAQDKISQLLEKGVAIKSANYRNENSIKYIYTTDSYSEESLVAEAVTNAKSVAQNVAQSSGNTLGDVISIYVSSIYEDYTSSYFPSKQITIRADVSYSLKK
ncbi:MAG: SIMPL domain-containing protein [Campylobacteraceae bacterium]|jgi:hypothetical protein|nr:SIMPL domain-containing protein [Campylobacteraceae bacterium]